MKNTFTPRLNLLHTALFAATWAVLAFLIPSNVFAVDANVNISAQFRPAAQLVLVEDGVNSGTKIDMSRIADDVAFVQSLWSDADNTPDTDKNLTYNYQLVVYF